MKLNFTGRGAAFNVKEGNTNAYFVENEKLFMIDCGETMFESIQKRGILQQVKEVYTLVSHTHSDHCGSIGSFGLYCQYVLGTKLKIIVPHNEAYNFTLKTLMTLFGNTERAYEFIYEEEIDGQFEAFDSVRYDLTKHAYELTCHSFVFETKQGAVFYSADTRVVDNLLEFVKKYDYIDKIYMEVTDLNNPGDIHLSLDKLLASIDDEIKNKTYMMHFRNDICFKKVMDVGFKVVECC